MKVLGATSRSQAERAWGAFRVLHPQVEAAVRQLDTGCTLEVRWDGRTETANGASLTLWDVDGHDELAMTLWQSADGGTQVAVLDEIESVLAVAPSLPECPEFVGAGRRCESCKIRKAMHA